MFAADRSSGGLPGNRLSGTRPSDGGGTVRFAEPDDKVCPKLWASFAQAVSQAAQAGAGHVLLRPHAHLRIWRDHGAVYRRERRALRIHTDAVDLR
jgi:hypothetical protein